MRPKMTQFSVQVVPLFEFIKRGTNCPKLTTFCHILSCLYLSHCQLVKLVLKRKKVRL